MFAYFIPTNETYATPEVQAVLPYAWSTNDVHSRQVHRSVFGDGLIVSRAVVPLELLQFNSAEKWRKIPGKNAWIRQVAPATPSGMARDPFEFISGYEVELGDGNSWTVPRAIQYKSVEQYVAALPRRDTLNDDGVWVQGDIIEKYRQLWSAVAKIMSSKWTYTEELDASVSALQLHYYVDAIECDMLELFSHTTRTQMWNAIMDVHGLVELKKKQESGGLSTEPGV